MMRLVSGALVASALVLCGGAVAQANWGPHNECGIEPEEHCYALAEHTTHVLASIAAENALVMEVHDWASGGFVDDEEWISFPGEHAGWIETGQTAGNGEDCCTLHQFYAEETGKAYNEYLAPGHVEGGLHVYNYFLLFDGVKDGRWQIQWGCSQNSPVWCEIWSYAGWPTYLTEQEAGVEDATSVEPNEWARQEVASSDGGEWWPWTGAHWYKRGPLEMRNNSEQPAAGDIEWNG
jgi:hypothetical protein